MPTNEIRLDEEEVEPEPPAPLDPAYGDCSCRCHRMHGVVHVVACCYPPLYENESELVPIRDLYHRCSFRVPYTRGMLPIALSCDEYATSVVINPETDDNAFRCHWHKGQLNVEQMGIIRRTTRIPLEVPSTV